MNRNLLRNFIGLAAIAVAASACVPETPFGAPVVNVSGGGSTAPAAGKEMWAFCGVEPSDPYAAKKIQTMAWAGIDATQGPCRAPGTNYSPAYTATRYADPQTYLNLTVLNATHGQMKTIVYDARLWSADANVREQAIQFWAPHTAWIRAWDMGDEFAYSPAEGSEWRELMRRMEVIRIHVTPRLGIGAFTNNFPFEAELDAALRDMPWPNQSHLSFDSYAEVNGRTVEAVRLATKYNQLTNHLMCAINTYKHGPFAPTSTKIKLAMQDQAAAGCDSWLIFGGEMPQVNPADAGYFQGTSLFDRYGNATSFARAIRTGQYY